MPFLHNQILSRGGQGGTGNGNFTLLSSQYPVFKTTTNDASSHSLEFTLHNQTPYTNVVDFVYYSALAQGSSFWSSGYTIEAWCYLYAGSNHTEYDNIFRLGTTVNNYGQAFGLYAPQNNATSKRFVAWDTGTLGNPQEYRIGDNLVLSNNQWYHFCIERGANDAEQAGLARFSYYINGTQRYSALHPNITYSNSAGSYRFHDTNITFGKGAPGPSTGSAGFQGLINSARISTGVRYGSTFTPQTQLTKDASTWFLVQLNNNYAVE